MEIALSFYGMTTGYGRIKTLTDASVRNCLGDIRAFRPTIMVGVPAVWETIRKGIIGKVEQSGALRKAVFNAALSIKRANVPGLKNIVDSVVFSQIRAQTGGRLRMAMSGGSKISLETQEFLSLALTRVIQGTSSMCCYSRFCSGISRSTHPVRLWLDRVRRHVLDNDRKASQLRTSGLACSSD